MRQMCVNEGTVHSQYFLCRVRYFQVAAEISKSSGGYKTKQNKKQSKTKHKKKKTTLRSLCVW